MEITKVELRIIIKEFLSASNRVLRANFEIYSSELSKFIRFLESNQLIYNYIKSCGDPEYDVKSEYDQIERSFGEQIFSLGTTNENEVANIYAIIKYLSDINISGRSCVFYGYSDSKKYQEKVNSFGDEVIRILITHIENYLMKVGIKMGMDEKTEIHLNVEGSSVNNSQVFIATEGSSVTVKQTTLDIKKLDKLIDQLLEESKSLNDEDQETVNECIETINTIKEENPKKSIIKMAISTLKTVAGTTEFLAAVTAIAQFVLDIL